MFGGAQGMQQRMFDENQLNKMRGPQTGQQKFREGLMRAPGLEPKRDPYMGGWGGGAMTTGTIYRPGQGGPGGAANPMNWGRPGMARPGGNMMLQNPNYRPPGGWAGGLGAMSGGARPMPGGIPDRGGPRPLMGGAIGPYRPPAYGGGLGGPGGPRRDPYFGAMAGPVRAIGGNIGLPGGNPAAMPTQLGGMAGRYGAERWTGGPARINPAMMRRAAPGSYY